MGIERSLKAVHFENPYNGKKRFVIAGGGRVGLRTAENLADQGHEVVLIESDEIALPEGALLLSTGDREELAGPETILGAGERYILAVESDVVDEVLNLMRG